MHFAETGLIEEFPDEFYHPFTISQRIYLLKKIQMCCEKDFYRILREPLRQLPENLHLCVRENDCELTYNTNNGKTVFLSSVKISFLKSLMIIYPIWMNPTIILLRKQ